MHRSTLLQKKSPCVDWRPSRLQRFRARLTANGVRRRFGSLHTLHPRRSTRYLTDRREGLPLDKKLEGLPRLRTPVRYGKVSKLSIITAYFGYAHYQDRWSGAQPCTILGTTHRQDFSRIRFRSIATNTWCKHAHITGHHLVPVTHWQPSKTWPLVLFVNHGAVTPCAELLIRIRQSLRTHWDIMSEEKHRFAVILQ